MEEKDFKRKLKEIVSKTSDQEIYSNIIKDFFTKGIEKPSIFIESLKILPKCKDKQLLDKFKENTKILCQFIENLNDKLDIYKALSCIFGSFYGDAIGGFCEFRKPSSNNCQKIFNGKPVFGQEQGQVTDDSEMSMCLAYAIMDNPEKEIIDPRYLYFYYGAWTRSNPIDMGKTTRASFKNYDFTTCNPNNDKCKDKFNSIIKEIEKNNCNSLSNGFLMRKNTFIVWLYFRFFSEINKAFESITDSQKLLELYTKIKSLAHLDNYITNPNPEADSASAFYCIMALGAIKGFSANNIIDKICNLCKNQNLQKNKEDKHMTDLILNSIDKFKTSKLKYDELFGKKDSKDYVGIHIGWYEHAFKLTLYYLVNYDSFENEKTRFKEILDQICNLGGDTDTNACIVGGVIGPMIGLKNFGENFDKVLKLNPPNRALFSISLMVHYIIYLKQSSRNNQLIKDERVFLKTILTMLYDEIDIDYL